MAARTVLLIRHGKAQSRALDIPDEQRALTKAGVRALRASLPKSAQLLKELDRETPGGICEVEVWTSPAERARQTAAEVLRALDGEVPLTEHESLLAQDFDAFCSELASTSASCVVAVGHNPFIEDALEKLTGAHIGFSTGALAAVQLSWTFPDADEAAKPPSEELSASDSVAGQEAEAGTPDRDSAGDGSVQGASEAEAAGPESRPCATFGHGRLLWFVQGARSQCWKTKLAVESVLAAAGEKVEARHAAFLEDPQDVETLHKLRVSIRTLRSLLAFAAPFMLKKPCKGLQRKLRRVVAETARLREYDVLLEQVHELELPADELLREIGALRQEERERVVSVMGGKEVARVLKQVRRALRDLPWTQTVRKAGIAPEQLQERFEELVAEVDTGFSTIDFADADAVHDLRKNAKRVRYVAENFAEVLAPSAKGQARRMVGVQDRLGAVCDARVNVDIICEYPSCGLSAASHRALGSLLEQNMSFVERFVEQQKT